MRQQRPILAIILRLASAMVFSIMFLMVKLAVQHGVKVPEILFWRQALSAPVLLIWLAAQGQLARLKTRRLGAHAMRALIGTTSMALLFTATALLPLAESTALGFATPLFAVILAATILHEQIGPWRWTAVLLGFAGVLLVAQPGGVALDPLGLTLALVAALVVAIINYQIRDLGRTEESICIVFWFGLFGVTIGGAMLPFYYTPHDPQEWWLLLGLGVTGLIGQLLLTGSLRFGSVSSVIVMDYSTLVWTALFGWLVWSDIPSAATWLGAPIIIAAGMLIAWREHHLSRQLSPISALEGD